MHLCLLILEMFVHSSFINSFLSPCIHSFICLFAYLQAVLIAWCKWVCVLFSNISVQHQNCFLTKIQSLLLLLCAVFSLFI